MPLDITEGIIPGPVRGLFYGVEGIGKTTLLAGLPNALVLDVEQGSGQVDCKRIVVKSADHLTEQLRMLYSESHGYKTVGVDTADWLETMIIQKLCDTYGKSSVEELGGGYGKGYIMVREAFDKYLTLFDRLIEKGINVVFIAHSTVKKVSPPDQTDGFDRYEMKLSKQVGPLLKEWASLILFCNYEISLVEGTDKKVKAIGGNKRVMKTVRSSAWDAKNRYGLPEELPMKVESILPLFIQGAAQPKQPVKVAETVKQPSKVAETVKQPEPTPAEEMRPSITEAQLAALKAYAGNAQAMAIIQTTMEFEGADHPKKFTEAVAAGLLLDLKKAGISLPSDKPKETPQTNVTPNTVKTPFPADKVELFTLHETALNAFFVKQNWISTGQTWRDLAPENAQTAILKTDFLMRAIGVKK